MANTYHKMYIQAVFAVKYRDAIISKNWRPDLLAAIGQLINETGFKNIIVNGIEDHVHCFFGLLPKLSVSKVMKDVKSKSSKWINEQSFLKHRFEWQKGFGAFSYGHSQIDSVFKYIKFQEIHHKKQTFKAEYIKLLQLFEVEYDPEYLFEDLI